MRRRIWFLIFLIQAAIATAQNYQWSATPTSDLLNLGSNWVGGVAPPSGNFLIFTDPSSIYTLVNNYPSPYFTLATPNGSNSNSILIDANYVISGGTFVVPAGGALINLSATSSGPVGQIKSNFTLNGTLSFVAPTASTLLGVITGSGGLTLNAGASIGLGNTPSTYSGQTTISAGATLYAAANNAFSPNSPIDIAAGGTLSLQLPGGGTAASNIIPSLVSGSTGFINIDNQTLTIANGGGVTYSGNISGSTNGGGGLTLSAGTLILTGSNTFYRGTINVASGADLVADSPNALGPQASAYMNLIVGGTVSFAGLSPSPQYQAGSLSGSGTVYFGATGLTVNGGTVTGAPFSGTLTGSGGLSVSNNGYLTLSGTNTYTGTTSLSNTGTLVISSSTALPAGSSLVFGNGGGTLQMGAAGLSVPGATLTASSPANFNLNSNTFTITGVVTAVSSNIYVQGPGTLILSGSNNINNTNTVFVTNGATLQSGSTQLFSSSTPAAVNLSNSTLNLANNSNTIGSLSGTGTVLLGSGTMTITEGSANSAFYGVISGSGGITVTAGNATLMGSASTYTGVTNVSDGGSLNAVNLGASSGLTLGGSGAGTIYLGSSTTLPTITIPASQTGIIYPNTNTVTLGTVTGNSGSALDIFGPGTTILGGTLTNVGVLALQGGTLRVNASSLSVSTQIQLGHFGAVIQAGAALTVTQGITVDAGLNDNFATPITFDANGHASTISGEINGNGVASIFNLTDSTWGGKLTLSNNANNWTGPTSILNGTLNAVPGAIPQNQLVFGGTLQPTGSHPIFQCGGAFTGSNTFTSSVVVMSQGGTIDLNGNNMNISGVLAGIPTATLIVTNTGGGSSNLTLSNGANIFQGTIAVTNANLMAGSAQAFGTAATINLETGGALLLEGFANTIGSLQGGGLGVSLGPVTLTVSNGNGNTFTGPITGSGGLTLSSGILTLSGSNTYTGATTVNGGTLTASNGNTSPFGTGSNIGVVTGATLNFGTVAAAGIPTIGNLTNTGTVTADLSLVTANGLTLTGYTQNSNGSLTLNLPANPGGSFLGLNASGALSLAGSLTVTGLAQATGSQINLLQGTSLSGTFAASSLPSNYILNYNPTSHLVYLSLSNSAFNWTGDGGSSTNMSVGTNWQGGAAPVSGDLLSFLIANAPTYRTVVNNIGAYTLSSTGVGLAVDSGFTLSGSAFVVSSSGAAINLAGTTATASTISAPFTLNGTASITGGTLNVPVLSGLFSGTGGITLTGGKVVLNNTLNNYTGTTTIMGGTLNAVPGTNGAVGSQLTFAGAGVFQLGAPFPAFASPVAMNSSGTIDLDGNAMTLSGVLSGTLTTSTLTVTNTGSGTPTLTLSGTANSFVGAIEVDHATLAAGAANAFGPVTGAASLTIGTSGALTLGANSSVVASLSGGGLGINLGTATLTVNNGNGNTFTGAITDAGGLTLSAGTLTLSGTNTYTGATTISGGTLVAGSATALPSGSLFTVNGTLSLGTFSNAIGGLAGSGTVNLGTAILTLDSGHTFSGIITGSSGGLTLSSGTQILSGTSAYSGATTISGGTTLQAGSTTALSPTSPFTIAGTLSLLGNSNTVGSISGAGTISLGSGGILTIASGAGNTFSGPITNSGGGGITLSSGTLTVSGPNTYTGPTTVNGGILIAANGAASPFGTNSDITVAGGATLEFGTVNAAGLSVGSLTNSGTVTADLSAVTAANGITLTDTVGYTQSGNSSALTLNLTSAPGASFVPIESSSGPITLGSGVGSLTVTGLAAASGAAHTVTLLQGTTQSGSFATTTVPAGYTVKYNPGDGTVYLLGGSSGNLCNGTWIYPGSGIWDTTADWSSAAGGNCVPGINAPAQILDTATFPNITNTSAITILLANAGATAPQNISLYNLDFTGSTTSYTLLTYVTSLNPPTYSTITLDGNASPKPNITVAQGSHTIYAPILLNKDSRLSLSGTLTMGIFSSISDGTQSSTLYISEGGFGSGTFVSEGPIFPAGVNIEGCTVYNLSSMTPSTDLLVNGSATNTAPLTLYNYSLILSPTVTVNGSAGTTIVNNIGSGTPFLGFGEIFTSAGPLSFTSATVTNTLGGQIAAASGQTFTITASTFTNDSVSILGSATQNIDFVSGSITNSGQMLADNYTQTSGATLQLNVASLAQTGTLTISGTGSLGGQLIVSALPSFTAITANQSIPLIVDSTAFTTSFASTALQNFPASLVPELVFLSNQILLNVAPASNSHVGSSSGPSLQFSSISSHNSLISRKGYQMNTRMKGTNAGSTLASNALFAENEGVMQIPMQEENIDLVQAPVQQQKLPQLAQKAREPAANPWNVYVGPIANFGDSKNIKTQPGLSYTSAGGYAGFDVILPLDDDSVEAGIGSILEYRYIWGNVHDNSGSLSINRVHGSIYGTILPSDLPELYFVGIVGMVYTWDTLTRYTGYNNTVHARGKTNEAVFDALGGVEYTFNDKLAPSFGNFSFTPLFHVQYAVDRMGGYKETGGGIYDLKVPGQTVQSLITSLGSRFDYHFNYTAFDLVLELDAEWQHEYFSTNRSIAITPFNLTNVSTESPLFGGPPNSLLIALDAFATLNNGVQVEGNWTFQWNNRAYDNTFFCQVGKEF